MAETQDAPRGLCLVHNVPFVWKEGFRKDRTRYAFWGCPEHNEDGSWCRERPLKDGDVPPGKEGRGGNGGAQPTAPKENPFKPAGLQRRVVKGLFWGPTGAGKTHIATLDWPRPVYLLDLEGGDDAFMDRPEFGFAGDDPENLRLNTRSYTKVMEALTWLRDNPGACQTLVIDPLTALSEWLRSQFARRADRRALRKGWEIDDADMDRRDWAKVSMHWKELLYLLTELRVHVVGICRDAVLYERKKGGGDQELEAIGFRPAAEKDAEYWFDLSVRLTHEPGGKRIADIYKDRWGMHQTHALIEEPTFENVVSPIMERANRGELPVPPEESERDVEADDRQYLESRERQRAEDAPEIARQKARIEELYQKLFLRPGARGKLVPHDDKQRRGFVPFLLRFHNCRKLNDVPPSQYLSLISHLEATLNEQGAGSLYDYRAPEHEERPEPEQPEEPAQDAPEDAERTLTDEKRAETIAWAREALRTLVKAEGLTLEQWAQQSRPKVRLPFPVRMEGLPDKKLQRFTLYLRSELTDRQVEGEREAETAGVES